MTVTEMLESAGMHYKMKEKDNIYTECPKCQKENLSINAHSGVFHCWTGGCGQKGHVKTMFTDMEFTPGEAPKRDTVLQEADRLDIENSLNNKAEVIEFCARRHLDAEYVMKKGLIGYDKNSRSIIFPFRDEKNKLIGAKYRSASGDQWIKGREPLLYLPDATDLTKEKIIIVEGEIDAITLKQFGLPACATLGAGKDKGLTTLAGIRTIILGYDMDPAGDAGAEKAAGILGRYRCKRVEWGAKDPNDWVKAGATVEDIITALKQAVSLATDLKSKNASDTLNEYITQQAKAPRKRLSWGYPRLDSFTHGIGGGMFIGVLAEAGTGKTTFIINAAINNAIAGTNVGICSLEEHPVNEVTPKVAATLVGRNPGTGGFAPEEVAAIQPQLHRIQIYNGDELVDSVIDWIRECYFVHDTKLVVCDYLQLLIPDERDVQQLKEICYKFKKLVKELPELCVVMIVQPKQKQKMTTKNGVVSNDELDGSDARGGAAINQSVDAMLTIRILRGHPNITQFQYTKVRGHLRVSKKDWIGQFTQLEYDHTTLRQTEVAHLIFGV